MLVLNCVCALPNCSPTFYAGITPHAVDRGDGNKSTSMSTLLKDFEARFSDLHQTLCSELAAGCIDTSYFVRSLTLLPLKLKKEYDKPIKEILPELQQQGNVKELLYLLNPLLHFIDYGLLEHLINQLGSVGLKEEIVVYCRDIHAFMNKTTVQQLIGYLPGEPEVPLTFEPLKVKIREHPSKCTLAKIDELRRQFLLKYDFQRWSFILL